MEAPIFSRDPAIPAVLGGVGCLVHGSMTAVRDVWLQRGAPRWLSLAGVCDAPRQGEQWAGRPGGGPGKSWSRPVALASDFSRCLQHLLF